MLVVCSFKHARDLDAAAHRYLTPDAPTSRHLDFYETAWKCGFVILAAQRHVIVCWSIFCAARVLENEMLRVLENAKAGFDTVI